MPNSPADKDGRLQPGDRILKINHMSMERASHNEALEALQQAPPYVHFTVYRDPDYQKLILNGGMMSLCYTSHDGLYSS